MLAVLALKQIFIKGSLSPCSVLWKHTNCNASQLHVKPYMICLTALWKSVMCRRKSARSYFTVKYTIPPTRLWPNFALQRTRDWVTTNSEQSSRVSQLLVRWLVHSCKSMQISSSSPAPSLSRHGVDYQQISADGRCSMLIVARRLRWRSA